MTELTEAEKDKLAQAQQNWIQKFEELNEKNIAHKIDENGAKKVADDNFFNDLKQLTSDKKTISYLETFREDVLEILGFSARKEFPIDNYKDLNKTRLAQEMADYAVYQLGIQPVRVGGLENESITLFKMDKEEGRLRPYPENRLGKLCKQLAEKEYSQHLEREFTRNLVNHPEDDHITDLGLDSNHVLLEDGSILDITHPDDPKIVEEDVEPKPIHRLNVSYEPDADCPEFKEFVNELLDEEEKQIKTLQEFMGWTLSFTDRRWQKALLVLGETNTGKSQLTEILEEFYSDYSVTNLPLNMIGMERTFHVSRLQSSVLNIDRDLASQTIESPHIVKQVMSQERLHVEDKGSDAFRVHPTAKHFICSNVSPRIENSDDDGFYSRFITLRAPNVVPEDERVKNLGQKLFEKEAEGIFNWMLEGLARLERNGAFTYAPEPYETKDIWNQYGNSAQKFVWYCLRKTGDSEDFIPTQRLYEHYEEWMNKRLETKLPVNKFSAVLKEQSELMKTQKPVNGSRRRGFAGVKLDPTADCGTTLDDESKLEVMRELVEDETGGGEPAEVEEVVQRAVGEGFEDEGEAEEFLKMLKKDGEVHNPKSGFVRLLD